MLVKLKTHRERRQEYRQQAKVRIQALRDFIEGMGKNKIFYDPCFDDESKQDEILAPVPDLEDLIKKKKEVLLLRESRPVALRPCYEEPLLSKEQEFHLFRKYSFLKYQFKKNLDMLRPIGKKEVSLKIVSLLEKQRDEINKLQQLLAASNFRLVIKVVYGRHAGMLEDDKVQQAYFDVWKVVDYFNVWKGFKFSTYVVWVLKKNGYRAFAENNRYNEMFMSVNNIEKYEQSDDGNGVVIEEHIMDNKSLVEKLLSFLDDGVPDHGFASKHARQIIDRTFGLTGRKETYVEISETFGCCRERVRQIREKALNEMKKMAKKHKIKFDP